MLGDNSQMERQALCSEDIKETLELPAYSPLKRMDIDSSPQMSHPPTG